MLDPFQPLPAKQRAFAQSMLTRIHQCSSSPWCARGAASAEGNAGDVLGRASSGTAKEAVTDEPLADDFGNPDYVAREVVKAEEVLDYTRDNVAERPAKRFGAAIGSGTVKALREMSPDHAGLAKQGYTGWDSGPCHVGRGALLQPSGPALRLARYRRGRRAGHWVWLRPWAPVLASACGRPWPRCFLCVGLGVGLHLQPHGGLRRHSRPQAWLLRRQVPPLA